MSTFKVKIENKTSNDAQTYIAYLTDGSVQSNSNKQLKPTAFFRTRPLSPNQKDEFKITPDLYGFVGNATTGSLKSGDTVYLTSSQSVVVGEDNDNGSELIVKQSGSYVQLTNGDKTQSKENTFTVRTQSSIPATNRFVTGVARNVNNEVKAVAALPVVPGQSFVIKPPMALYVALSNAEEDTIVDATEKDLVKVKVEPEAGQSVVNVVNTTEGGKNVLKAT
jgi:hypothetical protein